LKILDLPVPPLRSLISSLCFPPAWSTSWRRIFEHFALRPLGRQAVFPPRSRQIGYQRLSLFLSVRLWLLYVCFFFLPKTPPLQAEEGQVSFHFWLSPSPLFFDFLYQTRGFCPFSPRPTPRFGLKGHFLPRFPHIPRFFCF